MEQAPEHIQYMLGKIPRGRFLELSEAAALIAWLASEETRSRRALCSICGRTCNVLTAIFEWAGGGFRDRPALRRRARIALASME
jgi:hypothetical protein